MRGSSDAAIWAHAQDGDFIIVSKDDDFRSLALVRGPPPKVIWLQVGNAPTAAVANLLRANALLLNTFSLDPVEVLLSLRT
jgi:predicted nuclease of predicted toxin-antitoxin system